MLVGLWTMTNKDRKEMKTDKDKREFYSSLVASSL